MERTLTGLKPQSVLLALGASLTIMFQAGLENLPREQVGGIYGMRWDRDNGHFYRTFFYYRIYSRPLVIGNPMPPGLAHMWTQFATTNQCNHFCAVMGPVTERS